MQSDTQGHIPRSETIRLVTPLPDAYQVFDRAFSQVVDPTAEASVVLRDGDGSILRVFLPRLATVGRMRDADIRLRDSGVSRTHCFLQQDPVQRRVTLFDLDSCNGTWVNGSRVEGSCILRAGDLVRLGRFAGFWYFPAGHAVVMEEGEVEHD